MVISSKSASPQKNSIAVLDGVRAVACLLVIVYHIHYLISLDYNLTDAVGKPATNLLLSGWSGVTLFFVLSGFLLFMPYVKAVIWKDEWPSARLFYLKRMLRILPGYYLALFALILLTNPEYLRFDHLKLFGVFLGLLMDAPATHMKINGPFWTLAVEWQYYLILPWLALIFGWFARGGKTPGLRLRRLVYCLAAMILWGIITRYIGRYYFTFHPYDSFLVSRQVMNKFLLFTYGTTGKYYEDFGVGMLLCTIYIYTRSASPDHPWSRFIHRYSGWFWGAGILILLFLSIRSAFPMFSSLGLSLAEHNGLNEFSYSVGFGLCILVLLHGPGSFRHLLDGPKMRWVGMISYSLYIWHIPIFSFLRVRILPLLPHQPMLVYALYWLVAALIIFPFCYLVYRFVERPWMDIGRRMRIKSIFVRARPPVPPIEEKSAEKDARLSMEPLRESV